MMAIDGEDLTYYRQITWENCHKNIEVLFDPDFYFTEYNCFTEKGAGQATGEALANNNGNGRIVDRIFEDHDVNRDGKLSMDESQNFLRQYLEEDEFDQNQIATAFNELDRVGKGYLDKEDLRQFLTQRASDAEETKYQQSSQQDVVLCSAMSLKLQPAYNPKLQADSTEYKVQFTYGS